MSQAFKRGQLLEEMDLVIKIRNSSGVLFNPYKVSYAIYNDTVTPPVLVNNYPNRVPVNKDVGVYFAAYPIPHNADFGSWRIVWSIQELETTSTYSFEQSFNVVCADAIVPIKKNQYVSRMESILDITISSPSNC